MIRWSVNHPVTVTVIFILLVVLGAISLSKLGIEFLPNITLPTMMVITPYPGAGPEDVEREVTKVLEDELSTITGLDKIEAESRENLSVITLTFKWGTDLDAVAPDVRDKIDLAMSHMPDEVEHPVLLKLSASLLPILYIGVSAKESYPYLHKIVEDEIADPLRTVPGVGAVIVWGGLEPQVNVWLDRTRMDAYNLSIFQVEQAIRASNLSLPAGGMKIGTREYMLRIPGEVENIDDIGDIVVGSYRGNPIHLRDIANIEYGYKEVTANARLDRKPAVSIIVQKTPTARTTEVVSNIKRKLAEIKQKLPPDVTPKVVIDFAKSTRRAINNLVTTLIWGTILVSLTVLLFLRNLRGATIVGMTMPLSLIIAFVLLYFGGYTLNIISLSSLAVALGMVVDNAIVVFENIFRHRNEERRDAKDSAIRGATEVARAIIASTLTTIAIFVPMLFVRGLVVTLFKQLAFCVSIALIGSLFTALTLTPMMSSRLLRPQSEERGIMGRFYVRTERGFRRLQTLYRRVLGWAISHKKVTLSIVGVIFLMSLIFTRFMGSELLPETDRSIVQVTVRLPVGTKVEQTDQIMKTIEDMIVNTVPERVAMLTEDGATGAIAEVVLMEAGSNIGMVNLMLVDKNRRNRTSREIAEQLRKTILQIPGVKSVDVNTGDIETFLGGHPIEIEIYGKDLDKLIEVANTIRGEVRQIEGVVSTDLSTRPGVPEIWINVNKKKAASVGLSVAQIGGVIRTLFYGKKVGVFRKHGEEYDIWVKLKEADRRYLDDIEAIKVMTPQGKLVPLATIADIEYRTGPVKIDHKNKERVVKVYIDVHGRTTGEVVRNIRRMLAGMELPPDIRIKIGGAAEEQARSFRDLRTMLVMGIFFVLLVMAAAFESFIDPFIVLFSIPFAATGFILALFFTGLPLCLTSYMGLIMLSGIVVNNAIVLIDYTNQLRREGMKLNDAVLLGGMRRLRPVLMTAVTTMLGLTPLAVSRGVGSEIWKPFAVGVIGGLFVSTVITLIIVPVLYTIFKRRA